ncbi:MAG: hypothetical protein NT010_05675 [Proteobacteria bacterium]|nr:hypothetical protein [Pseudomonadota bacterium]
MKMIITVYNDAIDEVVIAALKKNNIKGYTKWKEAYGEGTETEPKLGTHYWPGKNYVLTVVVEDEMMPILSDMIKQLKQEHPKAGLKTFILQVEGII